MKRRHLLIAAMLLGLGACASTGNEAVDAVIDVAPSFIIHHAL